jgi:uncharacterized protein
MFKTGQKLKLILILLLSIGLITYVVATKYGNCDEIYQNNAVVHANAHDLSTQVADSNQEREQGLSGKGCMPAGKAMRFDFDTPGEYGIWMKNMKFAIDIVWLAEDKTVVHVENNVGPETYPKIFTPLSPAKYVLETKSGQADKLGLKLGDKLSW